MFVFTAAFRITSFAARTRRAAPRMYEALRNPIPTLNREEHELTPGVARTTRSRSNAVRIVQGHKKANTCKHFPFATGRAHPASDWSTGHETKNARLHSSPTGTRRACVATHFAGKLTIQQWTREATGGGVWRPVF